MLHGFATSWPLYRFRKNGRRVGYCAASASMLGTPPARGSPRMT